MANNNHATAKYKIIADSGGNRYRFFCDCSGMIVCTTNPIRAETQEAELKLAWDTEGKQHFNLCSKCGKHVSDAMYNIDTGECVDCSVWEEKPNYCAHCGKKIPTSDTFCRKCGTRLRYGEVIA